jgi:hypothetical protein
MFRDTHFDVFEIILFSMDYNLTYAGQHFFHQWFKLPARCRRQKRPVKLVSREN